MTVLNWLCRVYRLMLPAYPAEFRERYEDEMARVFHDRGREIVQSSGAWGLLGFALSTGRDWLATVFRERMDSMKMPSLSMVRWVFLCCVVLDLVLVARRATPAAYDSPLPFALLVMYGLLVLLVTTNLDDGRRTALEIGTSWGLISGVILTAWTVGGYFVRSDGTIPIFLAVWSMVLIFACWSVAGYLAARRTGSTSSGWVAGCWSGVVCVLIKVTCALVILKTPMPGQHFGMILTVSGQHLLEGPVIGAMLGAIAGLAGLIRRTIVLHSVGLAGGK
jgi:hypothetical protein